MKISIVTISFNQAPFLERAIRSVVEQGHSDVEYIVVDPGSTDCSRDIINRYCDRVDKIIFERDMGPADGLNKGFAAATGQIFGFLNSDDELLPGALARVDAIFSASPQTDILMGHSVIIDEDSRIVRRSYTDQFEKRSFAYSAGIICQQGAFFRSDLFQRTEGFNVDNNITWDAEMFLDLLLIARHPLYVDDFFGAFRIHRSSITGGKQLREEYRAYELARFLKIMGRPWRPFDWLYWAYYRIRKYAIRPRALGERLWRGPIRV